MCIDVIMHRIEDYLLSLISISLVKITPVLGNELILKPFHCL